MKFGNSAQIVLETVFGGLVGSGLLGDGEALVENRPNHCLDQCFLGRKSPVDRADTYTRSIRNRLHGEAKSVAGDQFLCGSQDPLEVARRVATEPSRSGLSRLSRLSGPGRQC